MKATLTMNSRGVVTLRIREFDEAEAELKKVLPRAKRAAR